MSLFFAIVMFAVWSSVFSLSKLTLQYGPPLFLTGVRMTLAGLLLLGFLACFRRSDFKLNLTQLFSLAILAFFSIYLSNALEFWGVQYLSAAKTCFIYSLSPLLFCFFLLYSFQRKNE